MGNDDKNPGEKLSSIWNFLFGSIRIIKALLGIVGFLAVISVISQSPLISPIISDYLHPSDAPNLQGTEWPLMRVLYENSNINIKVNNTNISDLYMRQFRIVNAGKNDINNLRVTYQLSPDGLSQDMDNNLDIFASISNSSPSPTVPIELSSYTKNSRNYFINRLGPKEAVSVLLLSNKADRISVKPSAPNFNPDQNFHIQYVQ